MKLYLLQAISENPQGSLNCYARELFRKLSGSTYIRNIPYGSKAYYPYRAKELKRKPDATLPNPRAL